MVQTNVPMSADAFVASLKAWGLSYREFRPDWRDFNRNGGGRQWGPVNGFEVHNFASDIPDLSSLQYLNRGDAARGMPPPLSQLALDDEGVVWLMGWGRANHAGLGDADTLAAVIGDRMPLDGELRPRRNTVDMNGRTVGVEMLYGRGPTAAQRRALPLLCAAFLFPLKWTAGSVLAHRESATDRSDPVGFDMGVLRTQVASLLRQGPPKPPPPPAPAPTPKVDDMPSPTDLWNFPIIDPRTKKVYTAADWLRYANIKAENAGTAAQDAVKAAADLAKQVAALKAQVDALTKP